jgi:V/A-type H+/Na+-transporting ATPase subunit K
MENLEFLNQLGPVIALSCGCIGSAIGCYFACVASHAAMVRVEEGHGKFIAMASVPSSQSIYGFILMLLMFNRIKAGELTSIGAACVGLFAGLAIMISGIYQGKVAAAGIQASLKQPSVYGKCFAAIGILESFALFALVFSLLII